MLPRLELAAVDVHVTHAYGGCGCGVVAVAVARCPLRACAAAPPRPDLSTSKVLPTGPGALRDSQLGCAWLQVAAS